MDPDGIERALELLQQAAAVLPINGRHLAAGIAALDVSRVPGFAAVEFALAAAGLLVSLAATAGMYRRSR